MCGTQNQSEGVEVPECLREALISIDALKKMAYENYHKELQCIIHCNITDENRIEALFDGILNFSDDEKMMELFWTLLHFVESFNDGIAAFYRREEELFNEGP